MKKIIKIIIIILFVIFSPANEQVGLKSVLAQNLININIADVVELDTLPGIGESKAQAIVDYRNNNGFFNSIEEIMNVSGIGQSTFDNIKSLIAVDSQAVIINEDESNANVIDEARSNNGEILESDSNSSPSQSLQEEEVITLPTHKNENQMGFLLGDVVINELVSDPEDGEEEWVELYSNLKSNINLDGWTLEEGSGKITNLSGIIYGNNFFVIKKPKGNLNNAGDKLLLKDELGNLMDKIAYGNWDDGQRDDNAPVAHDTKSMARKIDGYSSFNNYFDFVITEKPTPGASNLIVNKELQNNTIKKELSDEKKEEGISKEKEILIDFYFPEKIFVGVPAQFIGTTTLDEDWNYFWDFGDGVKLNLPFPEHTFFYSGKHVVSFEIRSDVKKYNIKKDIEVLNLNEIKMAAGTTSPLILINEIMPNPYGSDSEGEWIEIVNRGKDKVNLYNWKIDDNQGGSSAYKISENIFLNPGEFWLFDREDTGIALNNGYDKVVIYDDKGEVMDEIEYNNPFEGGAYVKNEKGIWQWSEIATPGEDNITKQTSKEINIFNFSEQDKIENLLIPNIVDLKDVKKIEKGESIVVEGVVSVLPGILGSQIFYIVSKNESEIGIQIYSYKKDFPDFKIGDLVEVLGEISEVNEEKRIKISKISDIKILDNNFSLSPVDKTCGDLSEELIGGLVVIEGEIIEKKGANLYVDDGSGEIRVFVKNETGINHSDFKTGDTIRVSGILGATQSGLRLLPRSVEDLIKIESADKKVLGEAVENEEWNLEQRKNNAQWVDYFLIVVFLGIGVLIFRNKIFQ